VELPARVIGAGNSERAHGYRPNFVRTRPVRLKFEGASEHLIPDLSASADVVLETSPEGPTVPLDYVAGENGRPFVYLREGEEFRRQPVELGVTSHIEAAVLSGIDAGQVIGKPEDVEAVYRKTTP
jgi:hypothetical protein